MRLFSADEMAEKNFLASLDHAKLKAAFRRSAKGIHPDLHARDSGQKIAKQTEQFRQIKESYEFLTALLNEKVAGEPLRQAKIIAVGGAKGGVGKSLFSANLAILLAARGYRTVAVDLDLGGANLPLYLGENYKMERTINDFLQKKYPTLEDIMIKGKNGPQIIGGDSSQLGNANIPFAQKLKMLRALKKIDADYIVLDLGGDTSFNILDFFLAGDYGIVVTTLAPASYISAYQFIKTALYRKLNRINGPESNLNFEKDGELVRFLHEVSMPSSGKPEMPIEELASKIKEMYPGDYQQMLRKLLDFNPFLVVNKVNQASHAAQVISVIQSLSDKMLSMEIRSPGFITWEPDLMESFMVKAPPVIMFPNGRLAREINMIIDRMLPASR